MSTHIQMACSGQSVSERKRHALAAAVVICFVAYTLSLGSNAGKLASLRRLLDRLGLADPPRQFNGTAATAASASLTANDLPLTFAGPWAAFQMLNKAKVQSGSATGTYDLSFALELANTPVRAPDGTPIVVDYELSVRARQCCAGVHERAALRGYGGALKL